MPDPGTAAAEIARTITVPLIAQADRDLELLRERTAMSETDLVNRAISLYEFIDAQARAGEELVLEGPGGTRVLVRLL